MAEVESCWLGLVGLLDCFQQQPGAESCFIPCSGKQLARPGGMFILTLFSPTLNVQCLWKEKARQKACILLAINTAVVHNLIKEYIKVYLGINIRDKKNKRQRLIPTYISS